MLLGTKRFCIFVLWEVKNAIGFTSWKQLSGYWLSGAVGTS